VDAQLNAAMGPGGDQSVGIGNIDFGQQGPGAGSQCLGDARYLPGKGTVGQFGDVQNGIDAGGDREGEILGHEHARANDVALQDAEQERPARGIGVDQAADVDVALGNDAVEWRDHTLIGLLLAQYLQLPLLRRDVGLRYPKGGLLRLERLDVVDPLLLREPTLADKRIVAI
jgi:hypothetical protein